MNAQAVKSVPETVERLVARQRVIDTITTLFLATDARDWRSVRACFAPDVLFDMTSLTGGEPQRLTPDAIVSAWEQGLRPIQAVHHQAGNFRVEIDGADARASCYGVAFHYLPKPSGNNIRVFVGSYDFLLRKEEGDSWVITLFRFTVKFVEGNLELEKPES